MRGKLARLQFHCVLYAIYWGLRRGKFREISKAPIPDAAGLPQRLNIYFWTPVETPGTVVIVYYLMPVLKKLVADLGLSWNIRMGPELPPDACDWLVCFKAVPDAAKNVGHPRRVLLICDQADLFWHQFSFFDEIVATSCEPFAILLATQHPRVWFISETEPLDYLEFGRQNLQRPLLQRGNVIFWHGNWHSQDALAQLRPVLEEFARNREVELHLVTNTREPRVEQWGRLRVKFFRWSKEQLFQTASVARLGIVPARFTLKYTYLKCAARVRCLYSLGVPAIADARVPDVQRFMSAFEGPTAAKPGEWLARLTSLWDQGDTLQRLAVRGHATVQSEYSTYQMASQWVRFFQEAARSPKSNP